MKTCQKAEALRLVQQMLEKMKDYSNRTPEEISRLGGAQTWIISAARRDAPGFVFVAMPAEEIVEVMQMMLHGVPPVPEVEDAVFSVFMEWAFSRLRKDFSSRTPEEVLRMLGLATERANAKIAAALLATHPGTPTKQ